MNNIIGLIIIIASAVVAGVLAWSVSKQNQRKEQKQREEVERRLRTQVQLEKLQREAIERQRQEEHQQRSVGDLENSLINLLGTLPNPTSERTLDFASKLHDYLKSGKWEEADRETLKIMLRLAGREKEGWLDVVSIEKLSGEALRIIDRLWVKYSNDRFGFSVQKRIWKSVGGNLDADDRIRQAFSDRVGWCVNSHLALVHTFHVITSVS
jgi:type II secretory pathway pseudopilin PulG